MAKLTRWGNSVGGLRLPKAIIEAAGLRVGDEISCRLLDSGAMQTVQSGTGIGPLESVAQSIVKW